MTYKKIIDFILRHSSTILIGLFALYLSVPTIKEFGTISLIVSFEMLAITLSGFALWAYTKINFTNALFEGKDGEMNELEQSNLMKLFGYVFLGVHFLVAIGLVGVYVVR